ncbi:hypothetical protein A0U89_15555 (plasmid) [Kozakia baliensis]|uniref:Uncharacterized protein n=1 Tax=Kozakia baliensis TaxID=153496 RepID=A0A1D8UYM3_9PROT|nr:hypothetical protein A0U89_15555 [Kozakia baliensis]
MVVVLLVALIGHEGEEKQGKRLAEKPDKPGGGKMGGMHGGDGGKDGGEDSDPPDGKGDILKDAGDGLKPVLAVLVGCGGRDEVFKPTSEAGGEAVKAFHTRQPPLGRKG